MEPGGYALYEVVLRPRLRTLLPAALALLVAFVASTAPRFVRPYSLEQGHLVLTAAAVVVAVVAGCFQAGRERAVGKLMPLLVAGIAFTPVVVGAVRSEPLPVAVAVNGFALVLFAGAAVVFAQHVFPGRSELGDRLSSSASFAAIACTASLVLRLGGSRSALPVDVLFLIASALLLFGSVRDARKRWCRAAAEHLLERQRAIAQELHDALGQELALMVTYTATLTARGETSPIIDELRDTAQRALNDSRRAMSLLTSTDEAEPTNAERGLGRSESLIDVLSRSLRAARTVHSGWSNRT